MIDFFPSRAVAIEILGFSVHWYGLLYFLAFLIAWLLLPRLQKFRDLDLSNEEWSNILTWGVVGVIAGGRLGYVLFYEPLHFLQNPADIIAVWKGGMSSHGGFIGVALAMLWALRARRDIVLHIADVLVVPVAIGLALGRVGNFINQELYGTVTTLPWGMQFPGAEGLRHPTQIYSVIKDLFIAGTCFWYLRRRPFLPGRTFALFLMLYGVLRFTVEFFREQNGVFWHVGPVQLSEGQMLTIPLFIAGMALWVWAGRRGKR